MTYKTIKELTPEAMRCIIGGCPSIYSGLRETTPTEMQWVVGACPAVYQGTRSEEEIYLIVGRLVNPVDAGLEAKVGQGEALIEVSRALIDNKGE